METDTSGVPAWLMQIDTLRSVAVGQFEVVHIVDRPEYIDVPNEPEYCRHAILWNDNMVPVVDLSSLVSGKKQSDSASLVAILIYEHASNEYSYIGIKLQTTPFLERVKNEQQCELPDNDDKWKAVSISCFQSSSGDTVPVLDISRLISQKCQVSHPA